jgi:hypothetical protein
LYLIEISSILFPYSVLPRDAACIGGAVKPVQEIKDERERYSSQKFAFGAAIPVTYLNKISAASLVTSKSFIFNSNLLRHAVAGLAVVVKALDYKPESRGFESR